MGSLPKQTVREGEASATLWNPKPSTYEGTRNRILHTHAQKPLWPLLTSTCQPIRAPLSLCRQLTSWRFFSYKWWTWKNNFADVAIKILLSSPGLGFHYCPDHYSTFSLRRSQLKTMFSSRKKASLEWFSGHAHTEPQAPVVGRLGAEWRMKSKKKKWFGR